MDNQAYLKDFLSYLELSGRKEKTIVAYRSDLKKFLHYFTKSVLEISTAEIRAFLLQKKTIWKKNATMSRKIIALKRFFGFLCQEGHRKDNPATHLKTLPPIREEKEIYSPTEIRRILTVSKVFPIEYQIYVLFFIETGLRPSEVCEIKREDLFLEKRKIYLSPTKVKSSKVAKVVFLSDEMIALLEKYLVLNHREMEDYLFLRLGKQRSQVEIWQMVSEVIDRAFPYTYTRNTERGPRLLRHTYCTMAKTLGVDAMAIQRSMGWSSLRMLENYTHLDEKYYRDEDKKFKKKMKRLLK